MTAAKALFAAPERVAIVGCGFTGTSLLQGYRRQGLWALRPLRHARMFHEALVQGSGKAARDLPVC